jgi:phenylacetate-coenzyme A ligase PaaK-like adenylate-forming protein
MEQVMNNSCFVFGKKVNDGWLTDKNVQEVLQESVCAGRRSADADIESILDVLDRVAVAWADPDYHLRRKASLILPDLTSFSSQMVDQGFAVISAICSRKNLEKRIKGELGSLAVLGDGEELPHLQYRLLAIGGKTLLHLTAGNVFVGAVDSLVAGIITKNANILKMSRVDPVFPVLFIESIKEHDPEGVIWPNQAVLSWKGGDEGIENPFLQADLTVVFWGGYDALASIKARIGTSTRLIENGPRYSFAVIEGAAVGESVSSSLVEGLALDISRWDQQACSSPHVVYVIDSEPGSAHRLLENLYDQMLQLSEDLPTGTLSFDEKVEVRRVRELARMQEARNEGRLICPEKFTFSLILDYSPEFKVSCLNRTVFCKVVGSPEELLQHVKPLRHYLQTVGIHAGSAVKNRLIKDLLGIGVKRITEIGGMSEGHDGAPHEGEFLLRRLVDWVSLEYRDRPESRIEKLLARIDGSAYYREILKKTAGHGFEQFLRLPLLDRETFYRFSPPESDAILTGPMTDAYVYASGGTTGSPKFTFYSNDEYRYVTDVLTDIYRNAGLTRSDRVANLFIAGNLWTSFNVAGRALENLGCLNLPVGGASDIDNILKYLKIFSVNAVVGLPSIIIKLAEEIARRKLDIRIEKILYGGEHLRPQTCEFLRQNIGADLIRSAGYACVDTGPIGWQCLHLEGSIHHVQDDYCYVEIIDSISGSPVSDEQPGEIVATNLDRVLMPVIRYRTGDMGRWIKAQKCACGFAGKSFELMGRCDDLLVIGGINLMPADIACALAGLPVSQSFQMAARLCSGRDQLCLRLEAETPLADNLVINALQKSSYKIAESLANGWMTVNIEWYGPGEIPRNQRTGKLKLVVDERIRS